MTHPPPDITVVIPTRAMPERIPLLQRAVASVLEQQEVAPRVIVIVNGARDDLGVRQALGVDPRVTVLVKHDADLPAALRAGAQAVETPWFATLDDDDLLLPGALKVRHSALERHPDRLIVVTNGIRRAMDGDHVHVQDSREIAADPLRALLRRNWLLPGSWLCRVTPETRTLFDGMPRYLECTYLGIRFAAFGMIWIDTPTMVYHVGTPFSESQSRAYVEGQGEALRRILDLELPPYARRALRRRITAAHHRSANQALRAGSVPDAWRWHLATLQGPGGWRYLPFMRHILSAYLRRRA
jgi:glycosyltransferase involved in cell wall biosynthesis